MNNIVWTKSYEDYKTEVGQELSRASESFVRIGYLLKVARDTEVLAGTEFEGDYIKFAEREFGLEKTQVSRFIRINDKFSVGGNSEVLKDEFKGYGTRKLGIMLTLPDEIVEELSPDLTVEEIETIQEEVKEEQKITPLEQYAESLEAEQEKNTAAAIAEDDILGAAMYQIMEEKPELFVDLVGCMTEERLEAEFLRIISPVPETIYITRVKGVGRLMLTFHTDSVTVVNARTNEKQKFSVEDARDAFIYVTEQGHGDTPEEVWADIYKMTYPDKVKAEEKKGKIDDISQKNDKKLQKTDEKVKKESEKVKKESRVKVTKEKKNAKKEQPSDSEPEKHEDIGDGVEERATDAAAGEGPGTEKESAASAAGAVHDYRPEESTGETGTPGETNLGGTEGEPSSLGTGETLFGEDSGAAGGEGNAAGTPERNKYSGRLEQLTHDISILIKEINNKGQAGVAGANWRTDALKTAGMMKECIQTIIKDLEEEEEPKWREIK